MKRAAGSALLTVALFLVGVTLAHAQSLPVPTPAPIGSPSPGAAGIGALLGIPFGDMFQRGLSAAIKIFIALVALELVIATGAMAMRQSTLASSLAEWMFSAVKAIVMLGVMLYAVPIYAAIQSQSCQLAMDVTRGLVPQGEPGTDPTITTCMHMSPVSIFAYGMTHSEWVFASTVGGLPIALNPAMFFVQVLVWIAIVACFTWIALDLLVILIESQIVLGIGVVFLGFLGSPRTKFLGVGILHFASTILMRMFFVFAFVGIGMGVIDAVWGNVAAGTVTTANGMLETIIAPFVLAWLVHRMDKIAHSITTGSSHMNMRDDVMKPLVGAVKAAVTVGLAAAFGAPALMAMAKGAAPAAAGGATGAAGAVTGPPSGPGSPSPGGGPREPLLPSGNGSAQPQPGQIPTVTSARIDDQRALPPPQPQRSTAPAPDISVAQTSDTQPPPPAQNPDSSKTSQGRSDDYQPEPPPIDASFRDAKRSEQQPADKTMVLPTARPRNPLPPPTTPPHASAAGSDRSEPSSEVYDIPNPASEPVPPDQPSKQGGSELQKRMAALAALRSKIHRTLDAHVENTPRGTHGISARPPI